MNVIELNNITKSYDGKTNAINNISLSIGEGEVFGFLGPNGAGKTTTMRILSGILTPGKGTAKIYGNDLNGDLKSIHKICGVMTETANCYEKLTGEENLMFFGRLYGLSASECADRIKKVMSMFDIYEAKDKKVGEYSSGMKKKIYLCRAFLHNPKILFLDEPTSGLDPEAARNVNKLIRKVADEENVTVFLCTHQLKYAEEICTLYGFINRGEMLGLGTFDELIKYKNYFINLEIRGRNIPKNFGFENKIGNIYNRRVASDEEAAYFIQMVVQAGGEIYEANQHKWDLEDLYFAYERGTEN